MSATTAARRPADWGSTAVALIGALYCAIPLLWVVVAATKNPAQLFSTPTMLPSSGLLENLSSLAGFQDGIYWRWTANSALYSLLGGVLVTLISAGAGYALAKYDFWARGLMLRALVAGVLLPQIVLAIPLYLLWSQIGLTNSYPSVMLPQLISPYAIFLCMAFAGSAIPNELIEAARIDQAGEFRIFWSIALPIMRPALVTVFLLQFVGIWNNYVLPTIMLSDRDLFPVTRGLTTMLATPTQTAPLYSITILGALLSVLPLIILFLGLQRFWRVDLISGAVKT
jgi:multiple sugar transport system permease protein